ncbi:hypothetical protein RHMOL_Rhmol05G0248800 [Rhododendron molle]|uniref:Uncharacterized protein n=1 Tax=Rhododendron molle TaxID=49168 RepID=A0ACC0NSL9_RHOML|nr:hypothetical protein RHMOL_Rhmol05G0248800 [Rhododendron molle]
MAIDQGAQPKKVGNRPRVPILIERGLEIKGKDPVMLEVALVLEAEDIQCPISFNTTFSLKLVESVVEAMTLPSVAVKEWILTFSLSFLLCVLQSSFDASMVTLLHLLSIGDLILLYQII